MKRVLFLPTGVVVLAALALASCGDYASPTAPGAAAAGPAYSTEPARPAPVLRPTRALRRTRVDRAAEASGWITPDEGGVLSAGGVTLSVPAGAVDEPVQVTMVVPAGAVLAVRFAPHGLRFALPATLSFDLLGTEVTSALAAPSHLIGIYFEGSITNGWVAPLETFDVDIRAGRGSLVGSMRIEHFSGYTMAEG